MPGEVKRTRMPVFMKEALEISRALQRSPTLFFQLEMDSKGHCSLIVVALGFEEGSSEKGLLLSNNFFPSSPSDLWEGCREDSQVLD